MKTVAITVDHYEFERNRLFAWNSLYQSERQMHVIILVLSDKLCSFLSKFNMRMSGQIMEKQGQSETTKIQFFVTFGFFGSKKPSETTVFSSRRSHPATSSITILVWWTIGNFKYWKPSLLTYKNTILLSLLIRY